MNYYKTIHQYDVQYINEKIPGVQILGVTPTDVQKLGMAGVKKLGVSDRCAKIRHDTDRRTNIGCETDRCANIEPDSDTDRHGTIIKQVK